MKLTGVARIKGVKGVMTVAAQIAVDEDASHIFQSAEMTDEAQVTETEDGQDNLLGLDVEKHRHKLNLVYVAACDPTALSADQDKSAAVAALIFPDLPSKVVLTPNSGWPQTDADPTVDKAGYIGPWIYSGGAQKSLGDGEHAKVTIPLWRPFNLVTGGDVSLEDAIDALVAEVGA